jgi:hypothetical protein
VVADVSAVLTLAEARRVQTGVMDFADDMTARLAERSLTGEHDALRIRACDRRRVSCNWLIGSGSMTP